MAENLLTGLSDAAKLAPEEGPSARPPGTLWSLFVRAWRPACGWLCAGMLARGIVVPLVQLARCEAVEAIDWTAFAAIAAVLVVSRSFDRNQGTA